MNLSAGIAAEVNFSAALDRSEITQEESVSLKLSIEQNGSGDSVSAPAFQAPDFDQLTSYQSQYVQSYYENGKFGMRNTLQVTSVLRPRKAGSLKISGIRVKVGNQEFTAKDLSVQVSPGGQATQPPQRYGGGFGLRGTGKRGDSRPFFVRAEINKNKLYKGEQLIVSYYLYRKVRVFNLQASQFPTLSGFLREELDMPLVTNRTTTEPVVLDGVAYDRMLLTRYAAYPLQEGQLKIDSLGIKANYYANDSGQGLPDDEDPFFQFFKRLSPKADSQLSEPLTVEVIPLPEAGRTDSFSGAVGEFEVKAAVDKTEVKAGDALTLTVLVEGRGNISSVKEPKVHWPAGLDPYETKARTKTNAGGVGEKVFEFLLIPRSPGELIVPALEFTFFNPVQKAYETRSTQSVRIQVLPGDPSVQTGNTSIPRKKETSSEPSQPKLGGLMEPGSVPSSASRRMGWAFWLSLAGLLGGGLGIGMAWIQNRRRKKTQIQSSFSESAAGWRSLESQADLIVKEQNWSAAQVVYEQLERSVLESLRDRYSIPALSLSRREIAQSLATEVEAMGVWQRCDALLEYSERVRFSGGDSGFQSQAIDELGRWIKEARALIEIFSKR